MYVGAQSAAKNLGATPTSGHVIAVLSTKQPQGLSDLD